MKYSIIYLDILLIIIWSEICDKKGGFVLALARVLINAIILKRGSGSQKIWARDRFEYCPLRYDAFL
jgi:hypothetical protein